MAMATVDEADVEACGFCALQILDADGHPKTTKGCQVESPWHFSVAADPGTVLFEASFVATNPLFHLQLQGGDAGDFLSGGWWAGGAQPRDRSGLLCVLEPVECQGLVAELEASEASEASRSFTLQSSLPFCSKQGASESGSKAPALRGAVRVEVEAQRLGPLRVASVQLEMPTAAWLEWKEYRRKLRENRKAWPAAKAKDSSDQDQGGGGDGDAAGSAMGLEMGGAATMSYDDSGPPPPCSIL
ncbi:unnamed protein product [Polarella glacialis]|uniref:Uncharacterized protein n=1 Tax=Polarella glacialis TaxID=89957 RepID=A0A813FA47_POLGL|nr:unnamed protein product [Polarella glacialis]